MDWYTRGTKPDRNIKAAAAGGALAFLDAVLKGKPRPLLHAATGAFGSALAMNEHRLIDRVEANNRNARVSEMAADGVSQLLDLAAAAPPQSTAPYAVVVAQWNGFIRQSGVAPARIDVPAGVWAAMTAPERQTLVDCAARDGIQLFTTDASTVCLYARPRTS